MKQNLELENGLIYLAPMEGVIDDKMRSMLTAIGGIDQCTTEFIRVTNSLLPDHVFYRYCQELYSEARTPSGTLVYIQLLGSDPQYMAENAVKAFGLGAPGVDVNFGCPAKTVNKNDGGATLLKNPERIYLVLSEMRTQIGPDKILTAKVRLGFSDKSLHIEIAKACEEGGANRLTVHARTRDEGYQPPAHWEYISRMRENIHIPTIANGDIWTFSDYLECKKITGCKDIALGRSALSNPFLPLMIKSNSVDKNNPSNWQFFKEKFLTPFVNTQTLDLKTENYLLCRTKQWLKYLSKNYHEAQVMFEEVKQFNNISQLKIKLQE